MIDCLTLCEQHFQAYDCAQFFVISILGFARTDSRGFTFNALILEFFSAISYVRLTHVLAWTREIFFFAFCIVQLCHAQGEKFVKELYSEIGMWRLL